MKKTISLAFVGAAILALAACSDDTETRLASVPTVTLSPTSVTLSSEAVEGYTISYTVANAEPGAAVSASADASWVSGVDASVSGQVRFSVAENPSDGLRTADLTLTYSYDGGSVTAKAAIVQYGADGPALSVDPNAVVAPTGGGTCSFGYSVDNPIEGEGVDCSADVDWISGFDYSVWGEVSFDVGASYEQGLRTGVITVTYAGLTREVDVVQDRAGEPSVSVSPGSLTAPREGGELSFSYTLRNPVGGEGVDCSADVDWITGFADDGEGTVTFTVAENTEFEARAGVITVSYVGSEAAVAVSQEAAPEPSLSVSPSSVTAPYEGGEFSFAYTLENPVGGEGVDITADVDWITGITDSDATVTFRVAENTSSEPRTGVITVAHAGLEATVTVTQRFDTGESLVGTYNAAGYTYAGSGVDAYTTWTIKIYEYDGSVTAHFPNYSGSFDYYIDGLAPSAEGGYDYYGDHRLSAAAYIDGNGNLVVPTQVLDTKSSGYYVGWTPCVAKSSSGWSYSSSWPDLTFVYNESTECWEADYGVFMGAFTSTSLRVGTSSGFYSFFDVVSPGNFMFTMGDLPDAPDDGDDDDGGDVDLSEFVGTYECYGMTYDMDAYDGSGAYTSWTMKIYDNGDGTLVLSGLVPDTVDYYPSSGAYIAEATVSGNNIRVSYPQWTGYYTSSGQGPRVTYYYICWIGCPQYDEGFYYTTGSGTCTFTYDSASDSWTSDVGLFLGLNSSQTSVSQSSFYSFYDVFAPGMTFTKTSSSTSTGAAPSSLKSIDERPFHTGAKAASAPAFGANSVTRSLGTLRMGDAKLAK